MTTPAVVRSIAAWPTNGHMIAEVARLYIGPDDVVLDPTYGRGGWWNQYRPAKLIEHDFRLDGVDFRHLPEADGSVDVVAFDPPYKLNGTPVLGDFDDRYGTGGAYQPWRVRHAGIRDGITEQARVIRRRGRLLLKCEDQVCSNAIRWQTREFADHAESVGLRLIDRFDFTDGGMPQPMEGRTQRHAHGRPSTLLVFTRR